MTRPEAKEQLAHVIEYLEPEARAWLNSDQASRDGEARWDAHFMLTTRLEEMEEADERREY